MDQDVGDAALMAPMAQRAHAPNFLDRLSGPARRALENAGISTLERLAQNSEKEILALHGMGPRSMPTLRASLGERGLGFREG